MGEYRIYGGTSLYGEVPISGCKNGALPLLFATILTEEECTILNVPDIEDIRLSIRILRQMGAKVDLLDRHTLRISTKDLTPDHIPTDLTARMRASSYLLGACLARFGSVDALSTGGCDFGNRPLDSHFRVFQDMGVCGEGRLIAKKLHGCRHTFSRVSVGATINALLLAAKIEEEVVLDGCAQEPHVVDLERFLVCMGAEIEGIGTSHLKIKGQKRLKGTPFVVSPDDIEAGTYLCAGFVTGGKVTVTQVNPKNLTPILTPLAQMGAHIFCQSDRVTLTARGRVLSCHVKTAPFPGFPTDMHPPLAALMCYANGESVIEERVWQHRFRYTEELAKMGASYEIDGQTLTIKPSVLEGGEVQATDLRGGAALVVAALGAKGRSVIGTWEYLERGYEDMPKKLRGIGADII